MLSLPAPCALVIEKEIDIDITAVLQRQRENRRRFFAMPRRPVPYLYDEKFGPPRPREWLLVAGMPGPKQEEAMQLLDAIRANKHRVPVIIATVAAYYGVTTLDVLSDRRTANIVRPRQVAMYLAKTLTTRSLPEIGRRFGGRDHTTVLHAVRKVTALRETDRRVFDDVASLTHKLMGGK